MSGKNIEKEGRKEKFNALFFHMNDKIEVRQNDLDTNMLSTEEISYDFHALLIYSKI